MARVVKPLQELTLLYVLEQKGSRWKNKIEGEQLSIFLTNLRIYLANVPEMRRVPAYLMLGLPTDMLPVPTLDGMYDFYGQVIDVIDTIVVGDVGMDIDNSLITFDVPAVINTDNAAYSLMSSNIEHLEGRLDRLRTEHSEALVELASKRNVIVKDSHRLSDFEAALEDMPPELTINTEEVVGKLSDTCAKHGFKILEAAYNEGKLDVHVVAPPRLMHDTDGDIEPIMTMPIFLVLEVSFKTQDISVYPTNLSLGYINSGYVRTTRYVHPHITASNICWGNIDIEKEERTMDVDGLLSKMAALIASYNAGSPYITASSFAKRYSLNSMKRVTPLQEQRFMQFFTDVRSKYPSIPLTVTDLFGAEIADIVADKYQVACAVLGEQSNEPEEDEDIPW